jgi:hypothetical protein
VRLCRCREWAAPRGSAPEARPGPPVWWWSGGVRRPPAGPSCGRGPGSAPTGGRSAAPASTDGLLHWHRGVGAVELVQRDLVQLQPPEAAIAGLLEVLGPAVGGPLRRPGLLVGSRGSYAYPSASAKSGRTHRFVCRPRHPIDFAAVYRVQRIESNPCGLDCVRQG